MIDVHGTDLSAQAWNTNIYAQVIEETINKAFEIEARGRKLASERDAPVGVEDSRWFEDFYIVHGYIFRLVKTFEPIVPISSDTIKDMEFLVHQAYSLRNSALDLINHIEGMPRSTKINRLYDVNISIAVMNCIHHLREYDKIQARITGKSGLWLLDKIEPDEYTWSAFINDLTACYHQLIVHVTKLIGGYTKISDKVYVYSKANPHALELALKWEEAVDILYNSELLIYEDYSVLMAIVAPSEIQFRVGSGAGHLLYVVLKPLGYEVTYYDVDDIVRLVLSRLAVDYGCRIIKNVSHERTEMFCPSLTGAADNFVKYVLPFVPSLDFRLRNPKYFWRKIIPDYEERFAGMKPEDIEYHACKWMIENVLKKEVG